jgi:hypothetical protein
MTGKINKISDPIREMMEGDEYGRVIFKVASFKQKFNTRTAALGNRGRHGYDIYTRGNGEDEVHVIKHGCEDLPGMVVDLRPFTEE